jgi:hypothetical protein
MVFKQIISTVLDPMLHGQRMPLSDFFGGLSYEQITNEGITNVAAIGTGLDQAIPTFDSIKPMMEAITSTSSEMSGAGSILEPLILLAGPGIISVLLEEIGSFILNSLLTPIFEEFSPLIIETHLNSFTNPYSDLAGSISKVQNISQDSSNIFIRSKISVNQNTPSGVAFSSDIPLTSESSEPTVPSDLLITIFDFISKTSLSYLNTELNPFTIVLETILKGISTLFQSTSGLTIIQGVLSIIDDLAGALKTKISNSLSKAAIQELRVYVEIMQVMVSFHKLNLVSNVNSSVHIALNAFTWLVKSGISLISDFVSFISDLFTPIPWVKAVIEWVTPAWIITKAGGVKESLYYLRAGLTLAGFITSVLAYVALDIISPLLGWIGNPLTIVQQVFTVGFLVLYFFESLAKFGIYTKKAQHNSNESFEAKIYLGGAVLEFGEMFATLFGLI